VFNVSAFPLDTFKREVTEFAQTEGDAAAAALPRCCIPATASRTGARKKFRGGRHLKKLQDLAQGYGRPPNWGCER
jgi:hypothetical protein